MKPITTVTSVLVMLIGLGIALAQETNPPAKAADTPAVKKQTVCPVTGEKIDRNIYADAAGKRVYFCCRDCVDKFKKDPAKYIGKLEKDGVTLDKAPAADPAKKESTDAKTTPAEGHEHSGHEHPGHEHPGR